MAYQPVAGADIVARYLRKGKVAQIPNKEAPRLLLLQWVVRRVPADQRFAESEINEFLAGHEIDHVTLRRLLVDYGFLAREHGVYWRTPQTAQHPELI